MEGLNALACMTTEDVPVCRFIGEFQKDMELLRCLPPSAEPRATEYVSQMVDTIGSIIKAGHAYEAEGSVWFSVESVDGYGRLSGRSLVSASACCKGLHPAMHGNMPQDCPDASPCG